MYLPLDPDFSYGQVRAESEPPFKSQTSPLSSKGPPNLPLDPDFSYGQVRTKPEPPFQKSDFSPLL